jgi:hypothetical protein
MADPYCNVARDTISYRPSFRIISELNIVARPQLFVVAVGCWNAIHRQPGNEYDQRDEFPDGPKADLDGRQELNASATRPPEDGRKWSRGLFHSRFATLDAA